MLLFLCESISTVLAAPEPTNVHGAPAPELSALIYNPFHHSKRPDHLSQHARRGRKVEVYEEQIK